MSNSDPKLDYTTLLGITELSASANQGEKVRIAVLDTAIPHFLPKTGFADFSDGLGSEDGSHASFIGSLLSGTYKVKGICPNAAIYYGKVFNHRVASPTIVAKAIKHAVDVWHVDIINLSLGFSSKNGCPQPLKNACRYAKQYGVIIVAAAGNSAEATFWPAALPDVISVGSSDGVTKDDYSNYGKIDVVAPGRNLPGQTATEMTTREVSYRTGTSYSTALVTGLLALIIAKKRKEGEMFVAKQELIKHCLDIDAKGWDPNTGYGFAFPGFIKIANKSHMRLPLNTIYDKIKMMTHKVMNLVKSLIRRH